MSTMTQTRPFPRRVGVSGAMTFFETPPSLGLEANMQTALILAPFSKAIEAARKRTTERGCRQRVRLWSQSLSPEHWGQPDLWGFWVIEDR